jgi:alkanesulfonate monooxygenase SsuD/methylene tetrahydromethanopterin reductase-like flavin-dependent oxidoreductase (luciferase family)
VPHDERYNIADEYLQVFYKLLEGSWRDGAAIKSQITNPYADPKRIRRIDHKGKRSSVAGPHALESSRQRTLFIFQADTSFAGKDFAVNNAEVMFVPGMDVDLLRALISDIRTRATK